MTHNTHYFQLCPRCFQIFDVSVSSDTEFELKTLWKESLAAEALKGVEKGLIPKIDYHRW